MRGLSQGQIWAAIDVLAQNCGLSASGLARLSGLDPTAFNRSKRQSSDGRPRWLSTESLAKVLHATDTSIEDFIDLMHGEQGRISPNEACRSVPLIGFAEAGSDGYFDDAGFPAGQGWEQIEAPAEVGKWAYALTVHGDSMMPLYRDGDVLIVDPGVRFRPGDRVVARTRRGEVMAKILKRQEEGGSVTLSSFNPSHPDRVFGQDEIDWTARIIWASQ